VRQYAHDNLDFLASLFDSDTRSRSKSSKGMAQTMSAELPSVQNGNGQTAVLSLEEALICIHNHIPESNLLFYRYTFPTYQQLLEDERIRLGFSILQDYGAKLSYLHGVVSTSGIYRKYSIYGFPLI
jgi:hypothetical protein